jgi:asparagine synthase (glutamine-hydrolysing)
LSPGKAAHAEGICLVATRPPAFGLAAWGDVINPLLSQEIVETCLRTPVYLLSAGGVDRALARRAFRHMLPPEILGRRSKGGTSGYFVRSCRANFAALEPYMLEGTLVRCDFVDRRALERLFTPESLECADNLFPLFLAITAEAWLRRIENHSPR